MGTSAFEILVLPVCWLTFRAIAAMALFVAVKSGLKHRLFTLPAPTSDTEEDRS